MNLSPQHPTVVTVTGGTGSFGRAFVGYLLAQTKAHVRIYSRDEHKQADMVRQFPPGQRVTYILGDVRSFDKLCQAFDGADAVVHAAALKTVPAGEVYADEFALTNVLGSHNVVNAAIECRVPRSLLISSDKAVSAHNHYGKTKAVAEGLFIQGNSLGTRRGCVFAVVRGGNVWDSRGSVAEVWRAVRADHGVLTVYGAEVTRFHLLMKAWTDFCWRALTRAHGGEILVPKLRAWSLWELARAFGDLPDLKPLRPGDKPHELMVSCEEAARTVDAGWAYVVEPSAPFREVWNYQPWDCPPVPEGWRYDSDVVERLSADELAELAR